MLTERRGANEVAAASRANISATTLLNGRLRRGEEVQGLGLLLPTNVRVYLELRKPVPDRERIGRLLKSYVYLVGFQGMMQVAMIVVMAKFVTGL